MDLFQPVTLHVDDRQGPIEYNNLRLAVIAVMNELAPGQRQNAMIRGRGGELGIDDITQLYEDLKPLSH